MSGKAPGIPSVAWLVLPTLALWPIWIWSVNRLSDGSDDPFGVFALLALLILLTRDRATLRRSPRPAWLLCSLLLVAATVLTAFGLPMLLRAALGVCAVMVVVQALRAPGQPRLAWFGLALLALPLLSSLQFFLGYPLRVVTAEVTVWILRGAGVAVERQGTALDVAGQLVMVDAPCSGIQMAWVAYFTAFVTAAWLRVPDRRLARRLPLVGVVVLAGNILRNGVLVMLESGQWKGQPWMHEGVGLLVFALVCVAVLRYMAAAAEHVAAGCTSGGEQEQWVRGRSALILAFVALALWPLLGTQPPATASTTTFVEWPQRFEGRVLQPLALSEVEQRFAEQFPGAIARFHDGQRFVSLRQVTRPSRKLHPAADCYRALGFVIQRISLERRIDDPGLQRCFIARNGQSAQRVCEYIEDAAGRSFSDQSSWYWAAQTGQSHGPWLAVSTAEAVGPESL